MFFLREDDLNASLEQDAERSSARRASPAVPPRATLAGFMALDDDPIDAGVVLRVALAAGQQADVIYSSDGRPRAIRLVSEATVK